MQWSLMPQLIFLVLNICIFLKDTTEASAKKEIGSTKLVCNDHPHNIQNDENGDQTGYNSIQNLLQLKYKMIQDSVYRIKRSAVYGSKLYKHLATNKENDTFTNNENDTFSEEIESHHNETQNMSKATSFKDRIRSLENRSHDKYATDQRSRNKEDSRSVDVMSKSDLMEKKKIQRKDKATSKSDSTHHRSETAEETSSMEHLLHEFSKRKNRPAWLRHLPQDTATDHTENKQYVVTNTSKSIYGSTNTTIQDEIRPKDAEKYVTTSYKSMTTAADPLGWSNSSEYTDSHLENNYNGTFLTGQQGLYGNDNVSFLESSTSPSTLSVTTDQSHPRDEGQHLSQLELPPQFEYNVHENEVNDLNETSVRVNHTKQIFSDDLKFLELDSSDSRIFGNLSELRDTHTRKVEKERNRIEEEKIMNKESNDSSDCPSCINNGQEEEHVKLIRLNMFKTLLARKLRLDPSNFYREANETDQGNVDRIPKIPHSIVEQTYKDNAREFEKDEFHARDQELIIAGEDMGRDCIKIHATGCYFFSLKGRIRGEVAEAQLWLYKMQDINDINGQTFSVYELERLKSGRLVQSSMIVSLDTFTKEDWVVLNVTRSLMKWVSKRKSTEMIAIRCTTCATRSHRALYGTKDGYKPLLIIKYALNSYMTRHKRSESCDPRYECCKRELVVNFEEIGIVEILQPRNLSVGYCYGGCNEIHQYTYNHTAIRQRMRWSQSLAHHDTMNQQLKPCCVPVVLKDIFIITFDDDGQIVRKLLPKVVVETCGCM